MSDALFDEITAIIRRTFGVDSTEVIVAATSASDIDGWDSLSHATLMIMIERRYAMDISDNERNSLETVGDLVEFVRSKQN